MSAGTRASADGRAGLDVRLGPVHVWHPERAVPVPELPERAALPEARERQLLALGVEEVRVADGLTEVDAAERAARQALAASGTDPAELDALLLVQGRAPEYLMASEATRLQHRLGATRAMTLSVGELGCVSSSAALEVGAALLRSWARPGRVLVAMGVRAPSPARYRPPMTVLGDCGAAVLLTSAPGPGAAPGAAPAAAAAAETPRYRLVDHSMRSDGAYADLFRIRYREGPPQRWVEECADENEYSFRLALTSRNRLRDLSGELLERNGLRRDQLAAVVMQNLSLGAFSFWQDALGLGIADACRRNLVRYGHLGPADVPLNLETLAPDLAPGDRVLALNSSPVAAWSAALVERLPTRPPDGPRAEPPAGPPR